MQVKGRFTLVGDAEDDAQAAEAEARRTEQVTVLIPAKMHHLTWRFHQFYGRHLQKGRAWVCGLVCVWVGGWVAEKICFNLSFT